MDFEVTNFDDEPHTAHELLRRGGKSVSCESPRLKAGDPDAPFEGEFEGYPTERGADVIYASRDDKPEERRRKPDFSDYNSDCIGF
ncbi:hypothetical protein [Haladaptatus halobius]|uniref:hypothetical protein n=1 Tax=Haladaptatus halobius TaxID=2884875 RepID=UPI001D0AE2AF|nr:hypothetical protein [Haladaptatus halobius]